MQKNVLLPTLHYQKVALVKRVYDTNVNYLGVPTECFANRSSSGMLRKQEFLRNAAQTRVRRKEEERIVEGESFLFAILSRQ